MKHFYPNWSLYYKLLYIYNKFTTMKKILSLIAATLICATYSIAQSYSTPDNKLTHMKKLENWVGNWSGEGWMMMGPGSKKEFTQKEEITSKLNGLLIMVEGKGTSKETQEIIHNAFALISYDEKDSIYSFQAHLVNGLTTDATASWNGDAFEWGFSPPNGGHIKYSIVLKDDTWHETGAYSADGNMWHQFFEMNLTKDK